MIKLAEIIIRCICTLIAGVSFMVHVLLALILWDSRFIDGGLYLIDLVWKRK